MTAGQQLYLYKSLPIDDFTGFVSMDNYLRQLELMGGLFNKSPHASRRDAAPAIVAFSMHCAYLMGRSDSGWEGDVRVGDNVFVFTINAPDAPCDMVPKVGLAWKQDHNGDTFFCSPVPMEPSLFGLSEWLWSSAQS